jgi:hypothetical protein
MTKNSIEIITITPENLDALRCCGVLNPEHEGRRAKLRWHRTQFKRGLRAKILSCQQDPQFGYIEYIPGEYAWRGVNAGGYMFIHCLWTHYRKYQHKGFGERLVADCIRDARREEMKGVAVAARQMSWLASSDLFRKMGFQTVDTAPPDYELLVKKFLKSAPPPSFKKDWEKKLQKYGRGLTIIRSDQCPHIAKFARDISEFAREEYGITPKTVVLRSYREAQNAPTPYAVFSIIYNGRLLADHQISKTRFRNIMNKIVMAS